MLKLTRKEEKMEEEYVEIGKINTSLITKYYEVKTDKLIVTKERIEHINKRHDNDYNKYGKYILEIVNNPDYILEDIENIDTFLFLKTINELNLQVVVKMQKENDKDKANTVITFWHMRKRSYNQIIKKNKKIFDINE